jgi:hypothetical protein
LGVWIQFNISIADYQLNEYGTEPENHADPDPQPWIKAHKIVLGLASEVFSHSVQRKIRRDHGLYGHKPRSFPPNRAPKMPESPQMFCGLWLVSRMFEISEVSDIHNAECLVFFQVIGIFLCAT